MQNGDRLLSHYHVDLARRALDRARSVPPSVSNVKCDACKQTDITPTADAAAAPGGVSEQPTHKRRRRGGRRHRRSPNTPPGGQADEVATAKCKVAVPAAVAGGRRITEGPTTATVDLQLDVTSHTLPSVSSGSQGRDREPLAAAPSAHTSPPAVADAERTAAAAAPPPPLCATSAPPATCAAIPPPPSTSPPTPTLEQTRSGLTNSPCDAAAGLVVSAAAARATSDGDNCSTSAIGTALIPLIPRRHRAEETCGHRKDKTARKPRKSRTARTGCSVRVVLCTQPPPGV